MQTLTMATAVSRESAQFRVIEAWARSVEDRSDGALDIEVFAAGELIGAFEVTDAVSAGQIDLGWTSPAFTPFFFPAVNGLVVPGDAPLGSVASESAWQVLTDTDEPGVNIEILAAAMSGLSQIALRGPFAGFEGLKIAAQGALGSVLSTMGVSVQNIPAGEVASALASGAIDGFASSFDLARRLEFDDLIAERLVLPDNALAGLIPFALMANEDALANLPPALRDLLLEETGAGLSRELGARMEATERAALEVITTPERALDGAALDAFAAAVETYRDGLSAQARAANDAFRHALSNGTEGALIYGTESANALEGSGRDDQIEAFGGDDTIRAADGEDSVRAGQGNDSVRGGADDDLLRGEQGDDTLDGDAGNDTLSGSAGDDSLRGDGGDDRLFGGAGEDTLRGGSGDNELSGGAGADKLYGGSDDDTLNGGADADLLVGSGGNDSLRAGDGDDTLFGNAGDDRLNGEDGDDWASGGSGDDLLLGRAGQDTMRGSTGDDRFFGGADEDVLAGNGNNDTIHGGSGDDRLFGGSGNDVLVGDSGADLLNGGSGADVFVFETVADSPHSGPRDEIADFVSGTDRIDLSGFAGTLSFVGSTYTGAGNEVRYNESIGRLYVDLDGDRASDLSIDLDGAPELRASDLIL
ncbi:M10 family metallopeptidase C-terminal domain-containing protein [Primorskyibacter sp. S187A]|uniref:M10 family metallopeptidase C-terminal domain-containing protein n=1 Tax=Primorskyibacter sp. S187A TaxID=3415130 RepID=UPI003C7B78B7